MIPGVARSAALGPHPKLVRRSDGRRQADQRQGETVRDLPTFRDASCARRAIVPVDGFFESRSNFCPIPQKAKRGWGARLDRGKLVAGRPRVIVVTITAACLGAA